MRPCGRGGRTMTCIGAMKSVSGNVWMAADSQASNNGTILTHGIPKIVRRDDFLFGSDGGLWLGDAMRYGNLPLFVQGMSLVEWCATHFGPWLRGLATEGKHWYDVQGGKEWRGSTLV